MPIERSKVVDMLRMMGRGEVADRAEQTLPDQVEPSQLTQMLQEQGINPTELLSKLRAS